MHTLSWLGLQHKQSMTRPNFFRIMHNTWKLKVKMVVISNSLAFIWCGPRLIGLITQVSKSSTDFQIFLEKSVKKPDYVVHNHSYLSKNIGLKKILTISNIWTRNRNMPTERLPALGILYYWCLENAIGKSRSKRSTT